MKTTDLKSLNEAVSSVTTLSKTENVGKGFVNSLTGKARQIHEAEEKRENEKSESPFHEKKEGSAHEKNEMMKKLAAKALKRAKKKAATNEEVELAEKAAPGYENWASDPKVKRSFKKQYGNRWKQVMYAKSWKMSKMDEETEQLDEEWGGGFQSYQDAHREVQAGLRREASIQRRKLVADIKAVHSGKMTKNAFTRKHKMRIDELPLAKKMAASRAKAKAKYLAKKAAKASAPKADSTPSIMESVQLDEAGYKRLMRLKKAAYAAQDKAYRSFTADQNKPAKLARAAAEREAQVAAGMARRGGASQEAVRGGGSRIGKSGKYTQKAGKLANQRDKALASFRTKGRIAQLLDKREDQSRKKRERQQTQAKFNMDARHGYFGHEIAPEIAKAGMRARYNYEKKYGRLKGK
jgi:hypothetical protein